LCAAVWSNEHDAEDAAQGNVDRRIPGNPRLPHHTGFLSLVFVKPFPQPANWIYSESLAVKTKEKSDWPVFGDSKIESIFTFNPDT
jgi:hypothetical protein